MPDLYDIVPSGQASSIFINKAGDEYLVYITIYYLMDPNGSVGDYIEVYMLGFECKLSDPNKRRIFDAKTRRSILFVFERFMEQNPDDAYVYVCDNSDDMARNRRVTFGRWFSEEDTSASYERYHSSVKFGDNALYSSLVIRQDNPDKDEYLRAFRYTIKQSITGEDAMEMEIRKSAHMCNISRSIA